MRNALYLGLLAAGTACAAEPAAVASASPAVPGAQANLLFVSDWGFTPPAKPGPEQTNTAQAMAAFVRLNKVTLDAVLVGGDNFKAKLVGPDDPNFVRAFEHTYDPKQITAPFYAIFGSHDYEYKAADAQLEYSRRHPDARWKMPGRWYRLDLPAAAPLVTVLMLDTDRDVLSKTDWEKQLRWMDEELSKPRQAAWTVCLGHHPLFSDGRHRDNAAMQAALGPLLKKYQVDFYLAGHDHVLNHLQIPGWGTTFVISGGGGENTNRPLASNRDHFVKAAHGFAALQFSATAAKASLVDDAGAVLHVFERDRARQMRVLQTSPSEKAAEPTKK
jgi:tartrate-resistant acid phosphatase type 5